jgi:type VII secretion-associated serine protease mycosin
MNRRSAVVMLTAVALALSLNQTAVALAELPAASAIHAQGPFDPNTVLVKMRPGTRAPAGMRVVQSEGETGYVEVATGGRAPENLAADLAANPDVADVQLNYLRTAAAAANDPLFGKEKAYLTTIRVPRAWKLSKGSLGQVIAVVDTGVDLNHPDLASRLVPGYDFVNHDAVPADDNGHGTFVAGIPGAIAGNGRGIAGVAWAAKIMPVKVLDSRGVGNDATVIQGVTWAADHGATVINLSLAGTADDPALHSAVTYAMDKGVVVVAAAGNDGTATPSYPAAYDGVVAVGATDASGAITSFSNSGDWVDVAAPGVDVSSTYLGSKEMYGSGTGTSFSTAIVSGVVALMRAKFKTASESAIVTRLVATATDAGAPGHDSHYGNGIVNAQAAVSGTI